MSRPEHIYGYRPRKLPYFSPSHTHFLKNLSQHIPFHTTILPPISIFRHPSFHSPHPCSISHMGYTRPPWAATQVTLYLYSRLDSTPRSSPGCSHISSRAQGLRRYYKPANSHSFSILVTVVGLTSIR